MTEKFEKVEAFMLKEDKGFKESDLQEFIAKNPDVLGLEGRFPVPDVVREHVQSSGGKVDLLFNDMDSDKCYTVEVQLGEVDESHIVRAIEYWDLERKRYHNRDYYAVLVAEKITNVRFFNVLYLLSQEFKLPLIVLEIKAIEKKEDGEIARIMFNRVLDKVDITEEATPKTREWWRKELGENWLKEMGEFLESLVLSKHEENCTDNYFAFKIGGVNALAFGKVKSLLRVQLPQKPDDEKLEKLKQALNAKNISHTGDKQGWFAFSLPFEKAKNSDIVAAVKDCVETPKKKAKKGGKNASD